MKPTDLLRECVRALQQQPGLPFIVVIGKLPAKGWPRGQCIGSDSRGKFYSYDAAKILVRLWALKVCTVSNHVFTDGRAEIEIKETGEILTLSKQSADLLRKAMWSRASRWPSTPESISQESV